MIQRFKQILRNAIAFVMSKVLLRLCPGLVNALYNALPHHCLGYLVHHGFFGSPTSEFDWEVRLANRRHLKLRVSPDDPFSWDYATVYKLHDVGLRRVQEQLVDQMEAGGIYLDIGANIGVSSIYALSQERNCWLFEPNTQLRPVVEALYKMNRYTSYRYFDVALSDHEATAEFHISKSSYLSSFDASHAGKEGETIAVQVPMRRLDSYLQELQSLARSLVVKIDVEGHELAVLKGGEQVLRHFQPPVMMELINKAEARAETLRWMGALGYSCQGIIDEPVLTLTPALSMQQATAFDDINFLFLPPGFKPLQAVCPVKDSSSAC